MVKFASASIEEVMPKSKSVESGPSERAMAQEAIYEALRERVTQNLALVLELEDGDILTTVMNRLRRAAMRLFDEGLTEGKTVYVRKVRKTAEEKTMEAEGAVIPEKITAYLTDVPVEDADTSPPAVSGGRRKKSAA